MPKRASRSYFIGHLVRTLLRGRDTVAFPGGPAVIHDSYQGQVTVDMTLCRGCGQCVRACPANALELIDARGPEERMVLYHDRCAVCGLCELACPSGAIRREPVYSSGAHSRDVLCEACCHLVTDGGDAAER